MLWVVLVKGPDILEQLAVSLVSEALNKPIDGRIKQALVLIIWQILVACLHNIIVKLEHVLNHEEQVVLVSWVDRVSDSGKISTGIGRTQGLSDATDHLSKAYKVRLMDFTLHVLLRADHGKLEIYARKDFTDAAHFIEPVAADFLNFVWDLSKVSRILVLVGDDDTTI